MRTLKVSLSISESDTKVLRNDFVYFPNDFSTVNRFRIYNWIDFLFDNLSTGNCAMQMVQNSQNDLSKNRKVEI